MRDNDHMPGSDLPLVDDRLAWKSQNEPAELDTLTPLGSWGGPIIVSMPRTGSTLLATLFLLLHDQDGKHVFERYIHEPVAPIFWEGKPIESVLEVADGRLTVGDIVQESAYQFTSKEIAHWFLHRARKPIAFVMRHPQLTWPSRWRIMLREWLAKDPDSPNAGRFHDALDGNDFSDLGDILTTRVTQPDNGWYSFMSLVNRCREEDIEFVIVDNGQFRSDPDRVLAQMCQSWGHDFDDAMTTWDDLSEAIPRIVMSDLAAGPEYAWYYAQTLGSTGGIIRTDKEPVPLDRFPNVLRGESEDHLTIDTAVEWYQMLLALPETI